MSLKNADLENKLRRAGLEGARTDEFNLNVLHEISGGDLRYIEDEQCWLHWDNGAWHRDPSGTAIQSYTFRLADWYIAKGREVAKADRAHLPVTEALFKYADSRRNRRAVDDMISLAKRDKRFLIKFSELDRNKYLLGVANGAVDLRTGDLIADPRDAFITRRLSINYEPSILVDCPRWEQLISEVTGSPIPGERDKYTQRKDLAGYLQRALGYSLHGHTNEQKIFICHGAGGNGKNVILDRMREILGGDISASLDTKALTVSKRDTDSERPTPGLRRLAGIRLAVCTESKDGEKLDINIVKQHTGGGMISARGMRENTVDFEISHKIWLMTNHRPDLDQVTSAISGRIHLIPFDRCWNRPGTVDYNPELPDGDGKLSETLKGESQGILAWLVDGAVAYNREGLNPPPAVTESTRDYLEGQDGFKFFIERYEPDEDSEYKLATFLEAYKVYCRENHKPAGITTQAALAEKLKSKGYKVVNTHNLLRVKARHRELSRSAA